MAPAVGMIELSRFDQPGGRATSSPTVAFDGAAMRGKLGDLVRRMVEDALTSFSMGNRRPYRRGPLRARVHDDLQPGHA